MKISNRLERIASFIKNDSFVGDVGADHGLLELYLLKNRKIKGIMAIENKIGPYKILENNLKDYNVILSFSDGISKIDEKVDTLVIAGMGGKLIVDILKANPQNIKNINHIITDSHRDCEYVRREIVDLGFEIENEAIVYEKGIYYFVISFVRGCKKHSDIELEWGYKISCDPLFKQYKDYTIEKLNNILKNIDDKNCKKVKIISKKIERLESL